MKLNSLKRSVNHQFKVENEETALLDKEKITRSFHSVDPPPQADAAQPQSAEGKKGNCISFRALELLSTLPLISLFARS